MKRALILAAGVGSRLGALTAARPKCLLPVRGRPLLAHWLDRLHAQGCGEALINTHYLADQVEEFLRAARPRYAGMAIRTAYEPRLLGTAGTIWTNQAALPEEFFLINGDVVVELDLAPMWALHAERRPLVTMAYVHRDNVAGCGIVELNERQEIVAFEEKPKVPRTHFVYAGLCVLSPRIFRVLPFAGRAPDFAGLDFGFDVLPRCLGHIVGYRIEQPLVDIGTPETYAAVMSEAPGSARVFRPS
ncbi:MAG: nucleotidyltransferase family protein [Deltaproteobacteria bacterium]|nr:nucleotidyltransferase family protein [Deltaproteobacteria bacterium]